jgi:hypothetical protein
MDGVENSGTTLLLVAREGTGWLLNQLYLVCVKYVFFADLLIL